MFDIIVATDQENGFGKNGILPWSLPKDLEFFHKITLSPSKRNNYTNLIENSKINAVIMGRLTWDSIPEMHRPLPNRCNIIISNTLNLDGENNKIFPNFEEALQFCTKNDKIDQIFIGGGLWVYTVALEHPKLRYIYQTQIEDIYNCDRFLPTIDQTNFSPNIMKRSKDVDLRTGKTQNLVFVRWERK